MKFKTVLILTIIFFAAAFNLKAKILIFSTQHFPPFSYRNGNYVEGPGVEIISRVCKEMKASCDFELLPWIRAQNHVRNGKSNAMFFIGKNSKREKWLYFSQPIIQTEYGFFMNSDELKKYSSPRDLKGLVIGVYGPSNTSHSLEKLWEKEKNFIIDMRPTTEPGFKKLSRKRINAVYSNRDVGQYLIKKLSLKNISYAGGHKKLYYHIGFSKKYNDINLVNDFNSTLKNLFESGELKPVFEKYCLECPEK